MILAADQIRVWALDIEQMPQARRTALTALLCPEEQARASRFGFEEDRLRFTLGRGGLRWLLGQILGQPPQDLAFCYGPQGKPALWPESPLQFNLAHAGQWILYACAYNRPVGVDVERVRPLPDMEALARYAFSPSEFAAWRSLPASQRVTGFFTQWTRREAYLKAQGTGFGLTHSPGQGRTAPPEIAPGWQIHDFSPGPGYWAAVAGEADLTLTQVRGVPRRGAAADCSGGWGW